MKILYLIDAPSWRSLKRTPEATLNRTEAPRDPLERLISTHENLERHLALLEQAASHVSLDSSVEDVMTAAAFFERAGNRHIEDEELCLFPALAGVAELR